MADYLAAQITIGGCLSRRLVPRLCQAIRNEGLALDWGAAAWEPQSAEELLATRQRIDGELVLRLCDDQARYGQFDVLERFLVKRRIPFDRTSDASYDDGPSLVVYRPEQGLQHWLATSHGQPVIPADPFWDLASDLQQVGRLIRNGPRHVAHEKLQAALEQLHAALPPRPSALPAFEIGKSIGLRKVA